MNMSQRGRQIMKEWAIVGGLLLVLHIGLFLGWWAVDPAESRAVGPVLVLVIVYLIGLCVTLVVSFRRISMAGLPQVYREARAQGVPASAKVLEIKRTRWRNPRTRNLRLQPRPLRFEYEMRLRVSREGASDYEAPMAEYLSGAQVPEKGDIIPVKVHPQHPDVIIMVLDNTNGTR